MNIIENLIDSNRGIYLPQEFAKHCNPSNSYWVWDLSLVSDLMDGPDNEFYWEAWETVLDTAYYNDPNLKCVYHLMTSEDGDLMAIKEGYYFNELGQLIDKDDNIIEL